MDVTALTDLLSTLPPLHLEAVDLYLQLRQAPPDLPTLVDLQPRIERALEELEEHTRAVRRMVQRCTEIPSSPSEDLPTGF